MVRVETHLGVEITTTTPVWHPDFTDCGLVKGLGTAYWACYMRPVSECYSTKEAALAVNGESK